MRKLATFSVLFLSGCGGCDGTSLSPLKATLALNPTNLDFGEVPIGVRVQGAVTVENKGDGRLTFLGQNVVDPGLFNIFKEPPRILDPSASDVILIEARPTQLGTFTARLRILTDEPEVSEHFAELRLVGVEPPPCDDGNDCTTDRFNADINDCEHSFADGQTCAPADRCIINAVCSQGVCLGETKVCDDGSPCTRDYCRQSDGTCVFLVNELACDDENPCTSDFCGSDGCGHAALPSGTPCDDGDLCTLEDTCFAGACTGAGLPDGSPCDDENSCTVGDTCLAGVCGGTSIITPAAEGDIVFEYPLTEWTEAFLHRREVSLGDSGVFYGLDHLRIPPDPNDPVNTGGLTHVVFAMEQCGTEAYQFAYRPPDNHVLVSAVRRAMQLTPDDTIRMVVGVRQRPQDGYEPQTTTYLLDHTGRVLNSGIQTLGGETGRSLLPDGSHIFGVIWPITFGPPPEGGQSLQNLVVVREDILGNVLWRHERSSGDWAEFLGVAGPRVLFWASGRFGALDFNTGALVWSQTTPIITKEMALSTALNLGVARASYQLIGVEILGGQQIFAFPQVADLTYVPRTDPVISADGKIMVLMERRAAEDINQVTALEWVVLDAFGQVLQSVTLPYQPPEEWGMTRHEDFDDPYPTVADDGVAYIGYGDSFWAINPDGSIRWSLRSDIPSAFTGTVPLLRADGILLISEKSRRIIGVRTNGGQMAASGWASFRHDGRRTNFTP